MPLVLDQPLGAPAGWRSDQACPAWRAAMPRPVSRPCAVAPSRSLPGLPLAGGCLVLHAPRPGSLAARSCRVRGGRRRVREDRPLPPGPGAQVHRCRACLLPGGQRRRGRTEATGVSGPMFVLWIQESSLRWAWSDTAVPSRTADTTLISDGSSRSRSDGHPLVHLRPDGRGLRRVLQPRRELRPQGGDHPRLIRPAANPSSVLVAVTTKNCERS